MLIQCAPFNPSTCSGRTGVRHRIVRKTCSSIIGAAFRHKLAETPRQRWCFTPTTHVRSTDRQQIIGAVCGSSLHRFSNVTMLSVSRFANTHIRGDTCAGAFAIILGAMRGPMKTCTRNRLPCSTTGSPEASWRFFHRGSTHWHPVSRNTVCVLPKCPQQYEQTRVNT